MNRKVQEHVAFYQITTSNHVEMEITWLLHGVTQTNVEGYHHGSGNAFTRICNLALGHTHEKSEMRVCDVPVSKCASEFT